MKKLMILASAIALACSAQAASMIWGFTGYDYVNANGEGYDANMGMNLWSGGKAYVFLGTVVATETGFSFDGTTLLDSGTYDADTWQYGLGSPANNANLESTAAGQAFSLILVDATDKELSNYEGNYVLVTGSSVQTPVPGAGDTTYYAEFNYSGAVTQDMWQTMAVPEPTSGLLMLLGMAGLALRRRRA